MGKLYDVNGNALVTEFPIGLHQMPENDGVLNVIKRARQLSDIKWTPAVNIPRINRYDNDGRPYTERFNDVFTAGVEYTGVPYSSAKGTKVERWGYTRLTTGSFIGMDTFATCVANADSFVSKESAINSSISLASMYGCTCCGFVSYAIDVPWTSSENFAGLISNGTLISKGLVSNASYDDFALADVLVNTEVHIALISDIISDEDGTIRYIEVAESTTHGGINPNIQGGQYGGHARRKGWAFSDFVNFFGDFTLCTRKNISTITYTPSPFVNVGDEFDMDTIPAYPCVPYMGENFAYKYGKIYNSDILIASDYFSELDVYKDGTLFNTFAVASETSKISVGFSAKGNYEAFLCNKSGSTITGKSKSCHWSVIS